MRKTTSAICRLYRQTAVFAAMAFLSALCLSMLAVRIAYTGNLTFVFLAWNLFLAWLPLASAFVAYRFYPKCVGLLRALPVACMGIWLVFLPNAPYLLTDLVHLMPRHDMSFWFDLTLLVAFAMTGLLYCLVSLYWMQQLVVRIAGPAVSWGFVLGVSALSSFGIYLGRFQHWNSWDVVSNPMGLLVDIWQNVRHPVTHFQTFAFSGLFTLFLMAAYFMLSVLTGLRQER
ncbi:MAG TPA: DUF1361 domain-containing protein [Aggregatilineales bacterium]|nr:DUF1361 domain-containing protein [Aggregatilineales bacterium]